MNPQISQLPQVIQQAYARRFANPGSNASVPMVPPNNAQGQQPAPTMIPPRPPMAIPQGGAQGSPAGGAMQALKTQKPESHLIVEALKARLNKLPPG